MRRGRVVILLFVLATGAPALVAQTEVVNWAAGVTYTYDGAGNVAAMANDRFNDRFVYDDVGRLVQAEVNAVRRNYSYDPYGNRTSCTQTNPSAACQFTWTINAANNRINQATYDNNLPNGPGNLTDLGPHHYGYDTWNTMTSDQGVSFLYTADDERVAVYGGGSWRWTIRDPSDRILREFTSADGGGSFGKSNWTWIRDYVWRDHLLLASRQRDGAAVTTYHYHLDHLGSPRRITDQKESTVGFHDYHAYGPEVAGGKDEPAQGPLQYTAQERDETGDEYTLDSMHRRFYNPAAGRFFSVDPFLDGTALGKPQRWNRYAYAADNPINLVDPTGTTLISHSGQSTILDIAGNAATDLSFRADGSLDTSKLTAQDIQGNEGALLLQEMALSTDVYTYEEGTTMQTRGGQVTVSGVENLDDNPTDLILPNGQPLTKTAKRFPVNGVNGAVTIDPATRWTDLATGTKHVPIRAIAFHELAESYAKVQNNILRGPNNGPGAHWVARLREVILMMQRPTWTPYPAGGDLKR